MDIHELHYSKARMFISNQNDIYKFDCELIIHIKVIYEINLVIEQILLSSLKVCNIKYAEDEKLLGSITLGCCFRTFH